MPSPTVELCEINRCFRLLVKLLGIADPNYPDGSVILEGTPYVPATIYEMLLQSDLEIREDIASCLDHPLRSIINFAVSSTLYDGDMVPFAIGEHSGVYITDYAGTQDWGILAPSLERLLTWRKNFAVFGDTGFNYYIDSSRIYFGRSRLNEALSTGVIHVPNITVDRLANSGKGALKSPVNYEWAVITNAVKMNYMHKAASNNRTFYTELAMDYRAQIRTRTLSLPKKERLTRLDS